MNKDKIPYAIEGILFAAGEPVKTAKLAAVLEISIDAVEEAVRILKYDYDNENNIFIPLALISDELLVLPPHPLIQPIANAKHISKLTNLFISIPPLLNLKLINLIFKLLCRQCKIVCLLLNSITVI